MGKVKIFCDDCDKWYTKSFKCHGDIPDMVCPHCKSRSIWFGDIDDGEEPESVELGRGGRRQK